VNPVSNRKRAKVPLSQREVPERVLTKARPPLVIVLGSPAEVVNLLSACDVAEVTCYQMDLYQAERLRDELREAGLPDEVVTVPDLWDLPADYQTALYPPPRGGERDLKIDVVEQAYHVLRPRGTLVVWSPQEADTLFPGLLKKVFGRTHADSGGPDTVLWSQRDGDHPRRRHEVTFQARVAGGEPYRFLSRPGTFSYGRFDDGARALAEVMTIEDGDRILDVGCGCGTNGIFAAKAAGPEGHVTFVDSNVRAVALAEHNARANGLTDFQVIASSKVEGPPPASFDVALANPPYYANNTIARLFMERSRDLLRPEGRFYLVTKQPNQMAPLMVETFGPIDAVMHRGYTVLSAGTDGDFAGNSGED
jgi:16S rRNA (guanine1207-N2)-methyltransferase